MKIIAKQNWENEWQTIKEEIILEWGWDDQNEDLINRETDRYFLNKFGFNYEDTTKYKSINQARN